MTLRSPIFRKLLGSAFALIAITLLVLDFYLTSHAARQQVESVERRLALAAQILAGELTGVAPERFEQWAGTAKARAQARITVIDPQGVVLADSDHDPETMENHAARPEVRQAAQGQIGSTIRRSATLRRDLCYVAIPLSSIGRPGAALRLAVPLEELDASIRAVRWRILTASAVAALVALLIAYAVSRRFTRRIGRLQSFAEGLAESRFAETLTPDANDEVGSLARSLNGMAAQLRDLVDKLSLESARREVILASMVEGVLAVDSELRVTFCNQSFAQAVGAHCPLHEKLPLLELVRDPDLLDLLTRVVVSLQPVKQRLELPAAAGRVFEIQVGPLTPPSRRGAIAVLHDITELERLERIRKDFVANVSHELRTPLTAILGYTETLLDGALEDKQSSRKFLEIIKSHSERLNSIASDLLTLSDLESGRRTPAETVPLGAAIDGALRAIEAGALTRGVNLVRCELEDAEILGARLRLEQALVNLLDNAVKFNRPGGEVRVAAVRTPDSKIRITIADTGIGIPSQDLPRLFERFYRVDKGRSRSLGGTGLGLSIVKHAIEGMNGTVAVESELGKGSTFTVVLPHC